jgi:hypothetical protein
MFLKPFIILLILSFISYPIVFRLYNYKDTKLSIFETDEDYSSSENGQMNESEIDTEEWEKLNDLYFKRSAAFYFADQSLLTVSFLAARNTINKINLTAFFRNENIYKLNFSRKDISFPNSPDHEKLFWIEIKITDSYFNANIKQIQKLTITITDEFNLTTSNPIRVKIKHEYKYKKGSLICTKCYELSKNQILDLMWWIEMNKHSGYDKIILCNNSIPKDQNLELFLNERKDFIQVVRMSYYPYFFNLTSTFLNKISDINAFIKKLKIDTSFSIEKIKYELIQYNECYYENKNKYKHIAIVDLDEVIMPFNGKISSNVEFLKNIDIDQCNDFRCLNDKIDICNSNEVENIDDYIERLNENKNFSLIFSNGYYFSDKTMADLFNQLSIQTKNSTKNLLINKPIRLNGKSPYGTLNFTFKFSSYDDIIYIEKITKIFNILINDTNIKKYINQSSIFLNRFFYLANNRTFFVAFKTIHDTYYMPRKVSNHNTMITYNPFANEVPYSSGHLSHFKTDFSNALKKNDTIYASYFGFDLNYLICYYPKILQAIWKV